MSTPGSPGNPRRRRIAGERRRPDQPAPPRGQEPPSPAGTATRTARLPKPVRTPRPARPPRGPRTGNPWPLFVGSLVLALALVSTALWLGLRTWSYEEVSRHEQVQKAERSASAAAERAAAAVLSFKHTSLDADLQAATRFMTPKFAKTYTDTFNSLARPNATSTKATVTATVLATAVINASEDRAEILVYVDQTTVSTANSGNPSLALNRTSFDMVKQPDGTWLVDEFHSY